MKKISLKKMMASATDAFKRFPFSIAFAFIGTIAYMIAVNRDFFNNSDSEKIFFKIGLFSILGFLTSLDSVLFAESKSWKSIYKTAIQFLFAALVVLYFFLTPQLEDFSRQEGVLFFLFGLTSLIAIFIAPYTGKNSVSEFWSFSRRVISRMFVSAFYGITLFGGLALALLAIHFLFQVDIKSFRYGQLFFLFFYLFGAWHFVAGIPHIEEVTAAEKNYPKGLKLFTQFVLIPLVTVYFIILYAYAVRILFLWELPQGWVSYLVLALSGVGILSFLFVWPLRNNNVNTWIKTYSHYFFIALAPLSVLLYVAILRRISDYGITPNRYYVLVAAIWVSGMILYFIFSKKKNIKIIPASLAVIALLTGFGPWSAYPVSEKSQISRLDHILLKNNAWGAGQPDTLKTAQLNDSICVEINQTLDFLESCNGGLKRLEKHWNMELSGKSKYSKDCIKLNQYTATNKLKLPNTSTYYYKDLSNKDFYWQGKEWDLLNISNYDYITNEKYLSNRTDTIELNLKNSDCKIYFSENNDYLILNDGDETISKSMKDYIKFLQSKGYRVDGHRSPHGNLNFGLGSSKHFFMFNVPRVSGSIENDSIKINGVHFVLLIKEYKPLNPLKGTLQ